MGRVAFRLICVCGRISDTALHLAVVRDNLECVKALLCSGTRVEPLTKNERGWNALHFAVQFGAVRLEILNAILDFRPDDGSLGNLHTHLRKPIPTLTPLPTHAHTIMHTHTQYTGPLTIVSMSLNCPVMSIWTVTGDSQRPELNKYHAV